MKYLFFAAYVLFPSIVFGQDSSTGLVTCSGPDCNFCTFTQMVDNIINWMFGFLVLAAVLVLVIAGFKLVTSQGNAGAMSDAKKMITNVVIGFIIILSAWTIVDTVIKALVDPSAGFGVWNQISDCGATPENTNQASNAMYCSNSNDGTYYITVPSEDTCSTQRQQFLDQHQSEVMNACHLCTASDYN